MDRTRDGHWLAGLTDGEGCFVFYVRAKPRPNCYSFDFTFKIALRADDHATLTLVQRILGVKGSTYTSSRARDTYLNGKTHQGKPLGAFAVYKKSEIAKIIGFFSTFQLRSKKARDFKVWASAFQYYCDVVTAEPIKHVSFAKLNRPSEHQRRPLAGTPKTKLRRTPASVLRRMQAYERLLKTGRRYRGR